MSDARQIAAQPVRDAWVSRLVSKGVLLVVTALFISCTCIAGGCMAIAPGGLLIGTDAGAEKVRIPTLFYYWMVVYPTVCSALVVASWRLHAGRRFQLSVAVALIALVAVFAGWFPIAHAYKQALQNTLQQEFQQPAGRE